MAHPRLLVHHAPKTHRMASDRALHQALPQRSRGQTSRNPETVRSFLRRKKVVVRVSRASGTASGSSRLPRGSREKESQEAINQRKIDKTATVKIKPKPDKKLDPLAKARGSVARELEKREEKPTSPRKGISPRVCTRSWIVHHVATDTGRDPAGRIGLGHWFFSQGGHVQEIFTRVWFG